MIEEPGHSYRTRRNAAVLVEEEEASSVSQERSLPDLDTAFGSRSLLAAEGEFEDDGSLLDLRSTPEIETG